MSRDHHEPEPRVDLVAHVRDQIDAGTYANDARLLAAADAFMRAEELPVAKLNVHKLNELETRQWNDYPNAEAGKRFRKAKRWVLSRYADEGDVIEIRSVNVVVLASWTE